MNRRSTCLSVALSVVRVAQPDRLGRRSSTFTLPPCQTSRAVLVNEVAISYCSMKHLQLEYGGKEGVQTVGSSCSRGKMNWEKTEMLICSSTINSAGVVFVETLVKPNRKENGGAEGRVTELGGCWGCCFAFFTRIWNSVLSPSKQWQIISNAHESSRLLWDVPFLRVFVIYFPFLYLNVSRHIKTIPSVPGVPVLLYDFYESYLCYIAQSTRWSPGLMMKHKLIQFITTVTISIQSDIPEHT